MIFWDFSMFYQIFPSPQLKRYAIITYKQGIYELPHELPNDLRLRILVSDILWVIVVIMFTPGVIVIKMSKIAQLL